MRKVQIYQNIPIYLQNPGGDADSSSSSTTVGSTTTKLIYPSVYIIEPSANYTMWVKKGEFESVSINAIGQDCVNMTAYVNGEFAGASSGNYLSCSYPITKAGQYRIIVVGTSKTGHTSTSARTVTVKGTYTVAYNLNEGEGVRCGVKGHSFVVVDSAYDSSVVYDDIRSIGACFTVYDSSGENGGTSYGGINFNESWSCEGRYSSTYVRPDDFSTLSYYEVIEHY